MVRSLFMVLSGLATCGCWVLAPAADAGCLGPRLELPAEPHVDRGTTLVVRGLAFGDNCYDTGAPPEGEGPLGKPVRDIELVVVQGGTEVLVARGHADAEYRFRAEIVVPARLEPGAAELVARWRVPADAGDLFPRSPLVVSGALSGKKEAVVVEFGARRTSAPTDQSSDEGADSTIPWPTIGIAGVVGLAVVVGVASARSGGRPSGRNPVSRRMGR